MKFQGIVDFIRRNESFIITAHETPDADALGAEVAMQRMLDQLGKRSLIVNADPAPRIFDFISDLGEILVLDNDSALPGDLHKRALIILDVNDMRNIGSVAELILPRVSEYFILDHHEHEGSVATANLIEEEASSTCELMYGVGERLGAKMTGEIALALYAGVVYDTGSFIYPKTSARTLEVARSLVECGVSPNAVYSMMYESNSISFLVLQSRVLASLELHYDKHVAIQFMLRSTLEESGAGYEEGQSLINVPLKSRDVRVSVFFKENEKGLLRCSLRSKGNIDVASIAQMFGGGGHTTAAGFKCGMDLDTCKHAVLEKLRRYFA